MWWLSLKAKLEQGDLLRCYAAGYTQENVLEVILGVGLKILSNYINPIAQTPEIKLLKCRLVWGLQKWLGGQPKAKIRG